MAKKNSDFFKVKKEWSKVKDELLACYLEPYLQKILYTRKKIVYVDCFAGKGVFEDGGKGSPLIALETMQKCLGQTRVNGWQIEPYFIDLNYAKDLEHNLSAYPEANIISGCYEDNIKRILQGKQNCNVFLYIDPYGIKALDYALLSSFSTGFNTIEMLINMNTFGFLRAGCQALGLGFSEESLLDDLIEYDTTHLGASEKSKESLIRIAGGDYWIKIIEDYWAGTYDIYAAEREFASKYCEKLQEKYTYVLNMPLKIRRKQMPKYRMIHVTNHPDGCLIMADNIQDRWQYMRDIQSFGQMSLLEETPENEYIDEVELQKRVIDHLSSFTDVERLNRILADFYTINGPICKSGAIKEIYKNLESAGKLEVFREPPTTGTGRVSKFFADEKNQKTELRWRG